MSFTILLLAPDSDPSWPEKIRQAAPGAVAKIYADPRDALADIATADAAYGTVPPELFARASLERAQVMVVSLAPTPSAVPGSRRTATDGDAVSRSSKRRPDRKSCSGNMA